MKQIIALFAFVFLFNMNYAADNLVAASDIIKPGTTLHYRVNTSSTEYPFIVKIVSLDMNKGITFEYDLQSSSPKNATIEQTVDALKNAQTMYNFFNGKDVVLDNSVSVFLSKKMFNDINNLTSTENAPRKTAMIKLDANDESPIEFNLTNYRKNITTEKGVFSTNEMLSEALDYTIRFAEDAKCPIITSMDLGWTVTLKKIE